MREIRFRLRDENNKIVGYEKWSTTIIRENREEPYISHSLWLYSENGKFWNSTFIPHRYKDSFTGLLDKNGKEIYEGDIVLFPDWKPKVVAYLDKHFAGFTLKGTDLFLTDYDAKEMEIIGSIHENPELLAEK